MAQEGRAVAIALVALTTIVSPRVRAEDEANRSIAQALFDDGVRLLEDARCDEESVPPDRRPKCCDALDKFRRAFALYPSGLGALRNAAFCERALGMTASALRDFREVARRAPLDPNPSKQLWAKHAAEEAEKLDKRVPRVVIAGDTAPAGARVAIDGVVIPEPAWGTALPLDPGEHVLVANAPGHLEQRRTFALEEREDLKLAIELHPIPPPPAPEPPRRSLTAPIALLASGTVTMGLGLGLGFMARSARDEACDPSGRPLRCTDREAARTAHSLATASTFVTLAGASVALVGGGLLLFGGRGDRHVGVGVVSVASGTLGMAFGAF